MSALGDVIVDAIQELLRVLFNPVEKVIEDHGDDLLETVLNTPHPNQVFGRPTNEAWPNLYDFHWDTLVPFTLLLWALSIGIVILLESTSHLFSSYHRSKLKKRAFSGLLGILSWWWVCALALRSMDALTGFLVPSLSEIGLFETLSFSAMNVLGFVIALAVDFTLFMLIAVIYLIRHFVLYLFVLLMPILIVLWIPGVGPFTLVSKFMRRLAGFFFPFLFMTVPVALLFRVGQLLGQSADLSMGGIGAWLSGLIIPIIAVFSPFFLFWQAGALFFAAERAASHMSAQRAQRRVGRGREVAKRGSHSGRNFTRGTRGKPAVRRDGQTVLGSGESRAHAAGSRLNAAGSTLRRRFSRSSSSSSSSAGSNRSESTGRQQNFENLRGRTDSDSSSTDSPRIDDEPRYYQ